jgi:copper chaperone CopZ
MTIVRYAVPGISCGHCAAAITGEVSAVPGVTSVDVSVDDKIVTVAGEAEPATVTAAIAEAGYEVIDVTAG